MVPEGSKWRVSFVSDPSLMYIVPLILTAEKPEVQKGQRPQGSAAGQAWFLAWSPVPSLALLVLCPLRAGPAGRSKRGGKGAPPEGTAAGEEQGATATSPFFQEPGEGGQTKRRDDQVLSRKNKSLGKKTEQKHLPCQGGSLALHALRAYGVHRPAGAVLGTRRRWRAVRRPALGPVRNRVEMALKRCSGTDEWVVDGECSEDSGGGRP